MPDSSELQRELDEIEAELTELAAKPETEARRRMRLALQARQAELQLALGSSTPKPVETATAHLLPYDQLSPKQFEQLCLGLVTREGYTDAEHLGASGGEQGRDIQAMRGGERFIFQCKRVRSFGPADAIKQVDDILGLPAEKRPVELVFLVTCDVSVQTRDAARARSGTAFRCSFIASTELDEKVRHYSELVQQFFRVPEVGNNQSVFDQRQQVVQGVQTNVALSGEFHGPVSVAASPDPRQVAAEEAEKARRKYLNNLWLRCQALPLTALGDNPQAQEDVRLEDVYIALLTTDSVELSAEQKRNKHSWEPDRRPLTALEAFVNNPRLALLGDPGSGKSTFIRNLLAWQAQVLLGQREAIPGLETGLLPVLVTLRDLATRLDALDWDQLSGERREAAWVDLLIKQAQSDLTTLYRTPEFEPGITSALESGQALLALDGLDEIPERKRPQIHQLINALHHACGIQRILLSSRVRSYSGAAVHPSFPRFTLAPFVKEQAERFCQAWYTAQHRLDRLTRQQADHQAQDLSGVIWSDDLRRLSENPMLLTTMAIIHQKETRLPTERVRLYNQAVQVLLERWQKHKSGEQLAQHPALAELLKDTRRVRKILERLAYEAHRSGKGRDEAADLSRPAALQVLEEPGYAGSLDLAQAFLDYVDQRAGLLVGRGGEPDRPLAYTFPHRTFQEYLAGCYLVNQRESARLICQHADEPDTWRLAVELGAEELYYNGRTGGENDVLDLAYQLSKASPRTLREKRLAVWSGKMIALVGRHTAEGDTFGGGTAFVQHLVPTLEGLVGAGLPAHERAEAGCSLAKLGDPRPEVLTCAAMQFCYIPAGVFKMGSDKQQDPQAFDDETPQHELELPGFWIGRTPVTQAQYAEFVQAEGYLQGKYWPEARAAKYWSKGGFKGGFDAAPRQAPEPFGDPFDLPNHPVVGVSWYEALAFTRWLEDTWKAADRLPAGWRVTLPNEAEWEKAARGGQEIPVSAMVSSAQEGFNLTDASWLPNPQPPRVYPWGDQPEPDKANYAETGIGATSAVGCFPGGASPYGVLDLSGNVWEWTRSLFDDEKDQQYLYPYIPNDGRERLDASNRCFRVLRGGSFYYEARYVRCAIRGRNLPVSRLRYLGFRVVLSHSPAGR